MTLYIDGHSFGYELQRVAQMFLFGEKVLVVQGQPTEDMQDDLLYALLTEEDLILRTRLDGTVSEDVRPIGTLFGNALEHTFGVMIYERLSQYTGLRPQWGVLTGVRPVKLFLGQLALGQQEQELHTHFVENRRLSEDRFALALQTAKVEQPLLQKSTPDSFSLYVSVPFCPSRCSYCSFVSHSVQQAAKLIPDYVDRLCDELAYTAKIVRELGLRMRTVYFGGGTPTTLSAAQLTRVMDVIAEQFDLSGLWEYTVEAGRPDTIDREKLLAIREGGAKRISINPQTLEDSVLRAIGRKHTAAEVVEAYQMAQQIGFESINMDLIAGLPTDTVDGFRRSVDGVIALKPENITVHTLTVKRAAALSFAQAREELGKACEMVDYARRQIMDAGLLPYYLYRQTGSLSGLENVGYALPGTEGLYNIYIMDETHSILAVGAGASTKLLHPHNEKIERIYNYKYPYEYVSRFDEAKRRKDQVQEFYRES